MMRGSVRCGWHGIHGGVIRTIGRRTDLVGTVCGFLLALYFLLFLLGQLALALFK